MGFFSHFMAAVGGKETASLPPNGQLIDVRTHAEFVSGHVDGAFNLPLDRFTHEIQRVVPDKATPVILYCRSGARSGHALSLMRELGYQQVFNGGSAGSVALQLGKDIRRGS